MLVTADPRPNDIAERIRNAIERVGSELVQHLAVTTTTLALLLLLISALESLLPALSRN